LNNNRKRPWRKFFQVRCFSDYIIPAPRQCRVQTPFAGQYVNVFNEKLLRELISFTSNKFRDDIFMLTIGTK
jgi:hypothetical protein